MNLRVNEVRFTQPFKPKPKSETPLPPILLSLYIE